eukprot:COSAG03_NODE_1446_length_4070_cov_7.172752_4_plen_97_part_00
MWDPVAGIFIEYATNVSLEDVFVSFVGTPRSGKQPCSNLLFLRTFQMKFASERDDDGGVHWRFQAAEQIWRVRAGGLEHINWRGAARRVVRKRQAE